MSTGTGLAIFLQSGIADILRGFGLPIMLLAVFYFVVFMPMQRRQKKTQEMLNSLKSGDKVLTSGGIYGTIVGMESDAVQLRISDQVKVKVARSAITGIQPEAKDA